MGPVKKGSYPDGTRRPSHPRRGLDRQSPPDPRHLRWVPPPTARPRHAASRQLLGGRPYRQRRHALKHATQLAGALVCRLGIQVALLTPTAQRHATGLGGLQRVARALAYHAPLLLGQGGVDVQHERVGIDTELGDDERHVMLHQTADVVHVAAQPIELRYQYWSAITFRPDQRLREHRTLVCVVLAALDLDEQLGDVKTLSLRKALQCRLLGLEG
jgi:hypothetical protein